MNPLVLVARSLAQRPFSGALTALGVALGVMLVVAVLAAQRELDRSYRRMSEGFSLVVGPPGSQLELVLNSVYHVGESQGLVPMTLWRELESPAWERLVRTTVPFALGDSYRGHRVVATTDAVFGEDFPQPVAGDAAAKLARGRPFRFDAHLLEDALRELARTARAGGAAAHDHDHHHDHDAVREAVLGAEVARTLGLELGDVIAPTHGLEGGAVHDHGGGWTVVGILAASGTPIDRIVLINLDSFYGIAEHAGGVLPGSSEAGLSAILVFPRGGYAKAAALSALKKRGDLTVAEIPGQIARLLELVGRIDRVFFWIAVLVVVVGLSSTMVALYNTMNERRREIAILRALGARRGFVLRLIVIEAGAIGLLGALLGLVLAHALLAAAAPWAREAAGLSLAPFSVHAVDLAVVVAVAAAAALAGLVPAWKAFRIDVARGLAPSS